MVIDRSREKVVVMGSPEGGVEIEEVAAKSPEKIIKEHVRSRLAFSLTSAGKSLISWVFRVKALGRRYHSSPLFTGSLSRKTVPSRR